jgi:hypothetical protein
MFFPFHTRREGRRIRMEHTTHANHDHEHRNDCGHTAIRHDDHTDYLHDGHLHNAHDGHTDEHSLELNGKAEHDHVCDAHQKGHQHGEGCGHARLPHDGHSDYLVGTHVHHEHGGHCDLHGVVQLD